MPSLGVILKPGFFSIPLALTDITGIFSKPAFFNALLINPM